ncbi:MAG TPA: PKD domain-containing protein [Solirubrobacteraceae bacterium]|nr:PKD domain-containing protein [Solirubrobacteraceae bacterium]
MPPALLGALVVLGALAPTVRAEFGELGSPFNLKANVNPQGVHAFGVNSIDGSFYVGDEPNSGEFRLQKFNAEGKAEASVSFVPPAAKNPDGTEGVGLQGIAIDPAHKRAYVLIVYARRGVSEKETKEEEAEEAKQLKEISEGKRTKLELIPREPLDSEQQAAGLLYGFESPSEKELVSVKVKEGKIEPLTGEGPTGLRSQGEAPKEALLDPRGIAVDPTTHDVIIAGREDEQPTERVEKGEGVKEPRAAVQLIKENGTRGPRYVDKENCLEGGTGAGEPACTGGSEEAFSPIVSGGGKLYVERLGEIWALPATSTEVGVGEFETHPKRLFAQGGSLVEFPEPPYSGENVTGGTMSFVPEGAGAGRIYLNAGILEDLPEGKLGGRYAGALVLDYKEVGEAAEATELGWTGGQSPASGEACELPPGSTAPVLLAGGKEGTGQLLLLDVFSEASTETASVYQFGPGGTGCRHAELTAPSVKVKTVEVSPRVGEEAELSSHVIEGNAKSAEWKFKELKTGAEEEAQKTGYQEQTTSVVHRFKHTGEYEVTEIVQTDDLASPVLEQHKHVTVLAPPSLTVEFSHVASIVAGQATKLTAKVADPEEPTEPHLKYEWQFGDGAKVSGEVSSKEFGAEHTYAAGGYKVTLKVTDGKGATGEKTGEILVSAAKEEHKEEPKKEEHKEESKKEEPKSEEHHKTEAHEPAATLAASSLAVSPQGAFTVKVTCPSGESTCTGTIMLQTLSAVSARARKHKKAILTLANGSFTVVGGQLEVVTLHLSTKARALLARSRVLRARATLLAHDPAGATHTTRTIVTLRLSKPAHGRKH